MGGIYQSVPVLAKLLPTIDNVNNKVDHIVANRCVGNNVKKFEHSSYLTGKEDAF